MLNDLSSYKSILCLNGVLPSADFFLHNKLPIIAADGATNALLERGVIPHLIIGDLDSVHPELLDQCPFLHLPDQNTSDYQKALEYLKSNELMPAIVVGINGGYLDHVLNNINIFMGTECLLYAPPIRGFVINGEGSKEITLATNTKISLLGIPSAEVSSEGLKWDLHQTSLRFPGSSSCFNRSKAKKIKLQVHKGSALVLFYESAIDDAGL